MEQQAIRELLSMLHEKKVTVDDAFQKLKDMPFNDMQFAKVDHHRSIRTGYPEAIFCQDKKPEHVVAIATEQIGHGETVFGTRASAECLEAVKMSVSAVETDAIARCFWKKSPHWRPIKNVTGTIVIASAGTADGPAAREALRTAEILGHPCTLVQDIGVAGIHRTFSHRKTLSNASVVIVVAGMEGALPSVVAGLISRPVIGLPTSVGYGAHCGGMVALLAMINSCAPGLTVVNIDNGFGAAYAAARINAIRGNEEK